VGALDHSGNEEAMTACKHVVLKRQDQPCPHPECSRYEWHKEPVPQEPLSLTAALEHLPLLVTVAVREYRRAEFVLDGERFFAWKEEK
jgi:hypothetical protein